jgi:hypothetical protein
VNIWSLLVVNAAEFIVVAVIIGRFSPEERAARRKNDRDNQNPPNLTEL